MEQKIGHKKEASSKKKYTLCFLLSFFCLFSLVDIALAVEGDITGYAWSDNIGWVSFSCANDSSCATSNYGVNIGADNVLTGYAWSDNIGWISFNSSDLIGCPSGTCNASLVNNKIIGWAKQINDSETGWIKLGPIDIAGTDYGVTVTGEDVTGYAWSDVFGWLSFNCANNSECGVSNYKVQYSSPVILSNLQTSINYCSHGSFPLANDGLAVILSWSYSSESLQDSYTIEISPNSNFASNVFRSTIYSASTAYAVNLDGSSWNGEKLSWSTLYHWRVKAENENGGQSSWVTSTIDLTSRSHGAPLVTYSNSPEYILAGRPINFEAQDGGVASQTYNGSSPIYSWTFTGADPGTSSVFDPVVTFSTYDGSASIKLRITDSAGYYCEVTEESIVDIFNPLWKDVSPF